MDTLTHPPTAEQSHILDLATTSSANLMLNALAGCGKSTTLEMVERAVKAKPILLLAFNKKIAEDASKRALSTTTVRTFNSLGHRVWAKAVDRNLTLDPKKSQTILRSIINETPRQAQGPIWDSYWEVINGVGLAKALGYIPEGKYLTAKRLATTGMFHSTLEEAPDDLVTDLIDAVLVRSIQAAYEGLVDFNDQIYMPALFGGTFPRFPLVLVDEYQDLNPTNIALVARLAKHRLIGVGDPNQSIYAFRGAHGAAMPEAQATYAMTPCDLSISFRCPSEIVKNARWRVPKFQWMKEGGHVETLNQLRPETIADESVIICRNNAPLFRLALGLLTSGRSVSVAGSDIGPKLSAILRKLGDDSMSQSSVISAIDDWLAERLAKGSTTAQDLADCMKVFASFGSTLGQAISYAEHLFAQRGAVRLLTIHKSKGLEFQTVYHLDPWLLGASEQELNLKYVCITRSMHTYYEINSRDIQWAPHQQR